MNLFTNPIHLVPLLERAVDALETIAAELVTARLERDALPREGETTLEFVRRTTPAERPSHLVGTHVGCEECDTWRREQVMTLDETYAYGPQTPCAGGAG